MKKQWKNTTKKAICLVMAFAMILTMGFAVSPDTVKAAEAELTGPYTVTENGSLDGANTSRNITFDKNGNAYVVYRDTSDNTTKIRKSTDGGKSWSDPVIVCSEESSEAEVTASDNGNIYVSYCSNDRAYIAYSSDGAETFTSTQIELQGTDGARSMHIAGDGDYVYGVTSVGDYCYVSADGGQTYTAHRTTADGETYIYTDVKVDSASHNVIIIKDKPSVVYYISSDHGTSFSEQKIPMVDGEQAAVTYSTTAMGGEYFYIAGFTEEMFIVNTVDNATSAVMIPVTTEITSRSLAADNAGNVMVGYVKENGSVAFKISNDHGETWGDEVEVTIAKSANAFIDPATGNMAFLYEDDNHNLNIMIAEGYLPPENPVFHSVTVTSDGNGTASANPESAQTGDNVTLTAEPVEGYQFKEWQVISGDVTIEDNSFTMGTADVEIKAIFEKIDTNKIARAKEIVEKTLAEIEAHNNLTKEELQKKLEDALTKAGIEDVDVAISAFEKQEATTAAVGKLSGTVTLTADGKSDTVTFERTIEQLAGMKVSGKVYQSDKTTEAPDVKITLVQGKTEYASTTSGTDGAFQFPAVPAGVYNLVAESADGKTKTTQMVQISDKDVTIDNIYLPQNNVQAEVKIEGEKPSESSIEIEKAVVDGLDAIADSYKSDNNINDSVKVEMQLQAQVENAVSEEVASQMKEQVSGSNLDYVDMQLVPYVNDTKQSENISDAKMVLTIVLPYDLTNKENIKVVRSHDGVAAVFDEYDTMPAQGAAEDGHFYIDRENSLIYIYARYFSTYAVAYTTSGSGSSSGGSSSGGSGSSSSSTTTVTPAKTSQEIISEAKTNVQQTIKNQTVTNATTKEEIVQAIEKALAAEKDTKNVSAEVISYTKVAPTTEKEGSISGIVRLTVNGVSEEVPFSYTIAKLPKQDSAGNSTKESFPYMIAIASSAKVGNKQVGMSWKKVKDADGYEVYASTCDGKNNFKRVADTKKLSFTQKKLNNSKAYKYYVRAYKLVNGKKVYLKKTVTIHVALKEQKYTNAKAVTLNKKTYALKAGQKVQIKAKTVKENPDKKLLTHTAEFRYYTDNSAVANVSANGKITAKKAGTCTIYVMANNGVYNTVKVTVK